MQKQAAWQFSNSHQFKKFSNSHQFKNSKNSLIDFPFGRRAKPSLILDNKKKDMIIHTMSIDRKILSKEIN